MKRKRATLEFSGFCSRNDEVTVTASLSADKAGRNDEACPPGGGQSQGK
ncbi:MAG: hypothetical protein NXH89_06425 [Cyclobacteriaceae bacterium]|nr:hypothetical protein [Cyclobacteriaceae bacterium]